MKRVGWALLLLLAQTAVAGPFSIVSGGGGGVTQLVAGTNISLAPTNGLGTVTITASSTGATAFSALTTSSNTQCAPCTMGTGGTLGFTAGGVVNANQANGGTWPVSAAAIASNASSQPIAATTTGSGSTLVLATSPALTTPNLGTPSAINLANGTNLPNTSVNGLGTFATANAATPPAIGGTTPAALSGTTVAATTQFSGPGTGLTGTAASLTAGTATAANALNSATTTVVVNGATAPSVGQVLTALNSTSANWQTLSASASSITPGTTTVVGATAPCLIDNSTTTTMGCAALGGNLAITSGTLNTTSPNRTVTTSATVASSDMGGQINTNVTGGGTTTIPAISSTVFPAGATLTIVNYSASTNLISTTPTINAGGGCVSGTGIPAGDTWQLISNGTTLDCNQTISTGGGGSGTVTTTGTPANGNLTKFSGGTSITNGDLSGDCTTSGALAITCTKTNGTAFSALATTTPGTGVATALGNALSAAGGVTSTIASGTSAMGTGAIASGACATVVTTAATNVATTDAITWSFNADPTAVTGYTPSANGMLTIISYPTANNVNWKVCNNTSASITPGAITLNWRVMR